MRPTGFFLTATILVLLLASPGFFLKNPDFTISQCAQLSNRYLCDSAESCTNFELVGQRDYCLWDSARYQPYPAEGRKVCQVIEKEFIKQDCLDIVYYYEHEYNPK